MVSSKTSSLSELCQASFPTFAPHFETNLQSLLEMQDPRKIVIAYDSEALLNTVEGCFDNPQGFLKKVCMKNLRSLLDELESGYSIVSMVTLMP